MWYYRQTLQPVVSTMWHLMITTVLTLHVIIVITYNITCSIPTSNTQLLFLSGLHHLHTDLIIQNVHNISLIGSTTNGTTPDTVIQCNSSLIIVMTKNSNYCLSIRSCWPAGVMNITMLQSWSSNVENSTETCRGWGNWKLMM